MREELPQGDQMVEIRGADGTTLDVVPSPSTATASRL